jgi:hypothetical protein
LTRPSLLERSDAHVAQRNAHAAAAQKVADAVTGKGSGGDPFNIYGADSDSDDGGKSGESKSNGNRRPASARSSSNSRGGSGGGGGGGLSREQRSNVSDLLDVREQAVVGHKQRL